MIPISPRATPSPIPTAVPVARFDVEPLADDGMMEELVEVTEAAVVVGNMFEDDGGVLAAVSLIFQPTMAIAPTVDDSTDTVVDMTDQIEPSSVCAQTPENPL